MAKKLISIVTPCYNEEGNVIPLYERVKAVFDQLPDYDFEYIFADNASTDGTERELRQIAAADKRVKVIFNMRNFGHIRSPYNALMQAKGDAVVAMVADLQDPPEMITEFLAKWEEGYPIVLGQKVGSEESWLLYMLRTIYYKMVRRFADVELLEHVTGFGVYDRVVMEQLRALNDPYPYVRGLISEFGYPVARIPYEQKKRAVGVTKNNFYTLYDMAMLGFTSHSKVPLRLAAMLGFASATMSLVAGVAFLVYKLMNWTEVSFGTAPLAIGLFFLSSVQLLFLGIVGEYVGAIHTQIQQRPLVVERERLNFDE
ncbi:MAG TPA: glycosyltransferase family 2 protein [Coriobacteriia bacterium]|nr:glycosyltransferase family 2 protein [Coriobacteriia bacterium]